MARAIETRWRCPPLSFTPRSPMIGHTFREALRRIRPRALIAAGS